jgi:hypothetical protein
METWPFSKPFVTFWKVSSQFRNRTNSPFRNGTRANWSWGSSVSKASDYRLDDRATGVRSPAEAKEFSSSPFVLTSSEAHPASYPVGTGGSLPGVKRGWGVTLTTSSAEIENEYELYYSPPCRLHGGSGTALLWFTEHTGWGKLKWSNSWHVHCCQIMLHWGHWHGQVNAVALWKVDRVRRNWK